MPSDPERPPRAAHPTHSSSPLRAASSGAACDLDRGGPRGDTLVAFYGSLMRGLGAVDTLGIGDRVRYRGPCVIAGDLFDLGPYPGLRRGAGRVRGELHALADAALLDVLDEFEGFERDDPARSLYLRERVSLLEPAGTVTWTYFYNAEPDPTARVPGGDWRAWLERSPGA